MPCIFSRPKEIQSGMSFYFGHSTHRLKLRDCISGTSPDQCSCPGKEAIETVTGLLDGFPGIPVVQGNRIAGFFVIIRQDGRELFKQ